MSEPFIGEIRAFGFNFAPRGWAFCNGQLLSIASNTALFSLLGTIYGGDGRTTFALPDLRGRMPMHFGNGAGLSNHPIGQRAGTENVTMTPNQMPSHNHPVVATAKAHSGGGNANTAGGNVWSSDAGYYSATYSSNAPDTDMAATSIEASSGNVGGNQSQTNMPPYLAINYCIALVGLFPSRN